MKKRTWAIPLLAASLLLTGCATTAVDASEPVAVDAAAPSSSASASPATAPTTAPTGAPSTASAGAPSDAAKMICGPETQNAVVTILGLGTRPHIVKAWADNLYTCTYHLPAGALVLSVKQSADAASALAYSQDLGTTFGTVTPINGLANLGFPAYETSSGVVVFVKDNMTLEVDASALPAELGPHSITRNALGYQLATDVLACWSH